LPQRARLTTTKAGEGRENPKKIRKNQKEEFVGTVPPQGVEIECDCGERKDITLRKREKRQGGESEKGVAVHSGGDGKPIGEEKQNQVEKLALPTGQRKTMSQRRSKKGTRGSRDPRWPLGPYAKQRGGKGEEALKKKKGENETNSLEKKVCKSRGEVDYYVTSGKGAGRRGEERR